MGKAKARRGWNWPQPDCPYCHDNTSVKEAGKHTVYSCQACGASFTDNESYRVSQRRETLPDDYRGREKGYSRPSAPLPHKLIPMNGAVYADW